LYDKTFRPPKAGSLREALFLSIWLRRQEAEVLKTRLLAQGLADMAGGSSNVISIFSSYLDAVLPFAKGQKQDTDKKMVAALKKEVAKGALVFSPASTDVLKKKAKTMRVPDDFAVKMQQRRLKGAL
jgi:hypothetical protein